MLEEAITDNNRVVQVWTASGTHLGLLMNIPPTGRQVRIHGVSVMTLANGKVQRGFYIWDVAGLLRSIGLLPEL
jgi:predicted ester cyclase